MQIVIETTGGKKYQIPTNKKNEAKDAIYAAIEAFNSGQKSNHNMSIADEIKK